jgi:uncharacterized lipoprotein NlpE involved in copper resistance
MKKQWITFMAVAMLLAGCESEINRSDPRAVIEAYAKAFVSGDSASAFGYLSEAFVKENHMERAAAEKDLEEYVKDGFITIKVVSFNKRDDKSAIAQLQISKRNHDDSLIDYELKENEAGQYEIVSIHSK